LRGGRGASLGGAVDEGVHSPFTVNVGKIEDVGRVVSDAVRGSSGGGEPGGYPIIGRPFNSSDDP